VNNSSEEIQMEIDEVRKLYLSVQLEELEKEISKLPSLTVNERSMSIKLKNSIKDIQVEHSQLKVTISYVMLQKILKAQIKQH